MGGVIPTPLTSGESNGQQTTSSADFPTSILGDKESSNLQALATGKTTLVEKKYLISGDFWANLGGEVDGLHYLLEQPLDDDNNSDEVAESTPPTTGLTNYS
jgi:hypothetical protein